MARGEGLEGGPRGLLTKEISEEFVNFGANVSELIFENIPNFSLT